MSTSTSNGSRAANGRRGSIAIALISALSGIVLTLCGVLFWTGGEFRALEDHIAEPHPSADSITHLQEDVTEIKEELKWLNRRLLNEHPIGPTEDGS